VCPSFVTAELSGAAYYIQAHEHAAVVISTPSLPRLQAFLLMVNYLMENPDHGGEWMQPSGLAIDEGRCVLDVV
jgi:hypothetical protein